MEKLMKGKFKLTLALVGCICLNQQVFCESVVPPFTPPNITPSTSNGDIVAAIDKLRTDTNAALLGPTNSINSNLADKLQTMNSQLTSLFDNTFKGTFDAKGELTGLSTIDTKINLYMKNFYPWYATMDFADLDFSTKAKKNNEAVGKMLSQEIGYNTQKDIVKKNQDTNALLAQPIEADNNNIDNKSLNLKADFDPSKDTNPTPYGSLDDKAPIADNAPTVNDLIGKDSYANEKEQNTAKLFISYLLKSVPPPRTFYIPSKSEATDDTVDIYMPYPSNNSPYTTLEGGVSTKTDKSGTSEYDRMVKFLNRDSKYYQKYKLKTRAANVTRTLYLENLYRLYQERTKDLKNKDDKSLVEKEKEAALSVLDKKYYDDLKKKSVADINLETLHAINKLAYFLYKINEDNERSAMIVGISAMQLSGSDTQDEMGYIQPIGSQIKNRCWNITAENKQVCENPQMGMGK